jgi:hypothetical protein
MFGEWGESMYVDFENECLLGGICCRRFGPAEVHLKVQKDILASNLAKSGNATLTTNSGSNSLPVHS